MKSTDFGGEAFAVGDLRALSLFAHPKLVAENGQEYLRSGTLRAYSASYALLASKAPGFAQWYTTLADASVTMTAPAGGGTPGLHRNRIYWNGTYYLLMPPCLAGGASAGFRTSNNLLTAGTARTFVSAAGLTGHAMHGNVLVCTHADGATPISNLAANGDANTTAATGMGTTAMACVATNGSTLSAAYPSSISLDTTSSIRTTADGITWSSRTGSSGAIKEVHGALWMPFATKFAVFGKGVAASTGVIQTTADGYTLATQLAEQSAYRFDVSEVTGANQDASASSPTVALIGCAKIVNGVIAGYGFLRTTDGVAFNYVSPWDADTSTAQPGNAVCWAVQWDSVRTRFVAWMGGGTLNSNTFRLSMPIYYTSTDGLTWVPSYAAGTYDNTEVRFKGFENPNGQDVAVVGALAGYTRGYPAAKFAGSPAFVGAFNLFSLVGASDAAYVRIK